VTEDSAFKKQVRARMAGAGEAEVAVGSEIVTVQNLRIDQIADAVNRRIPRAAGITSIAVWGDLDHVRVEIQADRPGVALGHSRAEYDRLRAELEKLTGKPVQLQMVSESGPPEGRREIRIGPGPAAG
jgi:ribosomal protein S3